jgi:colicin import membrane protein
MRTGVAASVVAHIALLIIALVGLGSAQPLTPDVVESIAVDLVPISDITNIRQGSLQSKVVKTETPAIVDTPKPAELAKPTGNTDQDQVKPQETDKVTPAPTVNTAPEPKPEPTPTPTPDPPKEPTPTPKPTPVTAPEVAPTPVDAQPDQKVAATAADTPADSVAPVPASKPVQLQKAPVKAPPKDTKVATVTPKPVPTPPKDTSSSKPQDDQAAKVAAQMAALINPEKSRGAVTGDSGQATLGKNTGKSATLTQSQLDGLIAKIKECFSLPPSLIDASDSTRVTFSLDASGGLTGDPQITNAPQSATEQALASAAKRAIMRCGPYPMAAGQDVGATFTAQQLL